MLKRFVVGLAAIALSAGLALADEGHDQAEHSHNHDPKHNGTVVHSGHHHLELVAAGAILQLYVTGEDGTAEDVSAAKATATVLADGKAETVTLAPAGPNHLQGAGNFDAEKVTTIVVSLAMPGHEPEQARFKLD